ncbi:TPA: hypothetical protein RTH04_000904 [Campylobacter jejuni]|nr:hypothetical protein [Campylobacter jejuni]
MLEILPKELFEDDFLKEHDYSDVLPGRREGNTLCFKSLQELKTHLKKLGVLGDELLYRYKNSY